MTLSTLDAKTPTPGACFLLLQALAASKLGTVNVRALRQQHQHLHEGFDWIDASLVRTIGARKDMAGRLSYDGKTLECRDPQVMCLLSTLEKRPEASDEESLDWGALGAAANPPASVQSNPIQTGRTASISILDRVPPYPWADRRAQWLHENVMTQGYRRDADARALAEKANVILDHVSFGEGIKQLWTAILDAATSQGKLRTLLMEARKDEYIKAYWQRIDDCVAPVKLLENLLREVDDADQQ